jgi:subtilisin family serine protease
MHVLSAAGETIELDLLERVPAEALAGPPALAGLGTFAETSSVARACRAFFEIGRTRAQPAPALFRERETGLLRTVYREIVVRFRPRTTRARRRQILASRGLEVRRVNSFVRDQVVATDTTKRLFGVDLVGIANALAEMDEVVFATPNFVSQYRRQTPRLPKAQWHLRNRGFASGQKAGEDVDALGAWKITTGKRTIVVAILDDGVDLDHPALKRNIWRNPNRGVKDVVGRDFFLPDHHVDHYNPRPKKFQFPFDEMTGNDIHGTPCAGIVAANSRDACGIAKGCRVMAVKIFHGDDLAPDERVADAIRYAASHADIISCSWIGGRSVDVELALQDAGRTGRNGRGCAVFCATGNEKEQGQRVGYPASDPNTIAVGASTDAGEPAWYSNPGPQVDIVAPSDGGTVGIFTTDVSVRGRGFNVGRARAGGRDGLFTNQFGGTSAATPLAAGVAALMLSVNPSLDREQVRSILRATAEKIGSGYDRDGHSRESGYGRVHAARAVSAAAARA